MKKILLSGIATVAIVLGFSTEVIAADLNVLTMTAEQSGSEISFTGTTDNGVLAVTCSLLDVDDNEMDMNSVVVESAGFEGSFTLGEGDEAAAVKCANYDGGSWVSADIILATEDEPVIPKAPDTGIAK